MTTSSSSQRDPTRGDWKEGPQTPQIRGLKDTRNEMTCRTLACSFMKLTYIVAESCGNVQFRGRSRSYISGAYTLDMHGIWHLLAARKDI